MTGKSSRDKGARYERKVAAYLTEHDIPAARRLDQWRDGGDDLALELDAAWLSVECKDVAATSVGAWLDQTVRSAGDRLPVLVHHRRGNADAGNDFATLRLRDLVEVLVVLGELHRQPDGDDTPPHGIPRPTLTLVPKEPTNA